MSAAINPYEPGMATSAAQPIAVLAGGRASFGASAAALSWRLPIAAAFVQLVLGIVLREERAVAVALFILFTMIYIFGLIMAVVAFCSIPRNGWRGILIPACVGLLLNGAILSLAVTGILFAIELVQRGVRG